MPVDPRAQYRHRIYSAYVTSQERTPAPEALSGLRPRLPYLRALVRRHFPADRDARILDLGCGYGALLHVLRLGGYRHAIGVDRSPEQVAAAQRLGIEGVVEGDLLQYLARMSDASMDVVVGFDVIEHFAKDELVPLVDQVRRVLRPGGIWIVHAPNSEGPFGANIRYGDFTHEMAFNRFSISQLLRASQFVRVAYFEDRPVVHGVISALRAIGWRIVRLILMFYVAVETGQWDRHAVFTQSLLAVAQRG